METDLDVLVVGAGPVGLTMACYLHHHGLKIRVIDKKSGPTQTSNAIGVQSRTLELLQTLGVANKIIEKGNKLSNFHIQSNKKELADWDMTLIDSVFPFLLSVSQKVTESVLLDYLDNAKVTVERNTELLSFLQTDTHVESLIKTPSGEEKIKTKYLSGCDGYRSTIRELLDIPYEGEDMPLNMLILDAPITGLEDKKHGYTGFTDTLSIILLPLENSWRIMADVAKEPKFHCKHDENPTEEMFQEILDRTLKDNIKVEKALWASKFLIHERLAKHYRSNRAFLSGDAAHAHSPAGAQGMNTGMQDAVNLAWKLAYVIKGISPPTLLESYETERRPVATQIIKFSGFLMRLGTVRNKALILIRDFLASIASKLSVLQKQFAANISEINVSYENSPIVGGKKQHHISPGDRIPTATFNLKNYVDIFSTDKLGKGFILLDFNDPNKKLDSRFDDLVISYHVPQKANEIIAAYGMEKGGYVLIRPDQFISYIGNDFDALNSNLETIQPSNK